MKYSKGDKVIYKDSITKKEEAAIIKLRKSDFQEGFINHENAKSGSDYLISVNRSGYIKDIWCQEKDLQ